MALMSIARDRWGQNPNLRVAALRSLGRLTETPRYISLLEEFIAGDNRKVVAAARSILRDLRPEGFPRRLVARGCLDHAAIRTYGDSREASSVPLLAGFLESAWRPVTWPAPGSGARSSRRSSRSETLRPPTPTGPSSGCSCGSKPAADGKYGVSRPEAEKIRAETRRSLAYMLFRRAFCTVAQDCHRIMCTLLTPVVQEEVT